MVGGSWGLGGGDKGCSGSRGGEDMLLARNRGERKKPSCVVVWTCVSERVPSHESNRKRTPH